MISPAVANVLVIVVTAVWVASFVVPMLSTSYRADPQIHLVFMAIVGGAMTLKNRGKEGKENGDAGA